MIVDMEEEGLVGISLQEMMVSGEIVLAVSNANMGSVLVKLQSYEEFDKEELKEYFREVIRCLVLKG